MSGTSGLSGASGANGHGRPGGRSGTTGGRPTTDLPRYGGIAAPVSPTRIAAYAGLAVLGLLVGAAGALVLDGWFPGGLLLALGGAAGLFHGGAQLTRTRLGAGAPAIGWMLAVILLTVSRPEGDFLFAAGAGSYLYLFGGILAAVMCATFPPPGAR